MLSPSPIIVIGAATALLEIIDLVDAINARGIQYKIIGALDDDEHLQGTHVANVPVLGGLAQAALYSDISFVFAISSYRLRLKRMEIFAGLGLPKERFVTLVHPDAEISAQATLGCGNTFHKGVVVSAKCRIGDFTVLYPYATVNPWSRMDDFSMLAAGALVGGRAHIGSGAFVGAHGVVSENVKVGPGGMVALASAAFNDVAPGTFVRGNPAIPVKSIDVPSSLVQAWHSHPPQ